MSCHFPSIFASFRTVLELCELSPVNYPRIINVNYPRCHQYFSLYQSVLVHRAPVQSVSVCGFSLY